MNYSAVNISSEMQRKPSSRETNKWMYIFYQSSCT